MINISKSVLLPIAVSLLISSCGTSTKRDCPAFFHPDYDKWAQQSVGDALVFIDQNGVAETFDVTQIERSVARQTEDFGGDVSDIVCDLTVNEVLVERDSSETIVKFFDHGEFSDRELDSEFFTLRIDFGRSADETGAYNFNIDIQGPRGLAEVDTEFYQHTKHAEIQIGGVLYQDVIQQEIIDEAFLMNPDQIRSVTLGNGFGLLQYTRVNGSVFSRM